MSPGRDAATSAFNAILLTMAIIVVQRPMEASVRVIGELMREKNARRFRDLFGPAHFQEVEKRLWDAADELRANTGLTSQEYSRPVLGLIFLRYAEYRFQLAKDRIAAKEESGRRRRGRGRR